MSERKRPYVVVCFSEDAPHKTVELQAKNAFDAVQRAIEINGPTTQRRNEAIMVMPRKDWTVMQKNA